MSDNKKRVGKRLVVNLRCLVQNLAFLTLIFNPLSLASFVKEQENQLRRIQEKIIQPCGDGHVGTKLCADPNHCCSQWGYCDNTPQHCNPTTCLSGPGCPSLDTGSTGPCGGGTVGSGFCEDDTLCCSKYGYCGNTEEHCDPSSCRSGPNCPQNGNSPSPVGQTTPPNIDSIIQTNPPNIVNTGGETNLPNVTGGHTNPPNIIDTTGQANQQNIAGELITKPADGTSKTAIAAGVVAVLLFLIVSLVGIAYKFKLDCTYVNVHNEVRNDNCFNDSFNGKRGPLVSSIAPTESLERGIQI